MNHMVSSTDYSEEQLKAIEQNTNIAMEVFDFIIKLPSPLSEFVFKQIVEDSYYIASVQQFDEIKKQLLDSICFSFQSTKSVDMVCKYLGILNHYKEVDNLIMDGIELNKKLNDLCKFDHLPPIDDLIMAFPCFSVEVIGDDYLENMWELVRRKIMDLEGVNDDNESHNRVERENCFVKLGYQSLFEKWACDCVSVGLNKTIYNWYCKGEIIDSILDTIFKCGVTSISRSVWDLLVKKCEQNYHLSIVTQQRYNLYRLFAPNLQGFEFVYKGEKKEEYREIRASLPCIPKSNADTTPVDDEEMYNLHERLCLRGELDCTFQSFKSTFSGSTQTTLPIIWLKGQKELASFLYVLRAGGTTDISYSNQAAKVFIQKNGKSCKATTLNQPDYEIVKEYKRLFCEVGIYRK